MNSRMDVNLVLCHSSIQNTNLLVVVDDFAFPVDFWESLVVTSCFLFLLPVCRLSCSRPEVHLLHLVAWPPVPTDASITSHQPPRFRGPNHATSSTDEGCSA